jgi:hypothetical protein
VKEDEDEEVED